MMLPPAGWYPSGQPSIQRWWDGQKWTDSIRAEPTNAAAWKAARKSMLSGRFVASVVLLLLAMFVVPVIASAVIDGAILPALFFLGLFASLLTPAIFLIVSLRRTNTRRYHAFLRE
jgi:uncharacterized membrane protein